MMFGYLGGVVVALLAVDLVLRGWATGDPFLSRFELERWLSSTLFSSFACWVLALLPFTLIRKLAGPGGLANVWRSVGAGIATFFLTFLPSFWLVHAFLLVNARPISAADITNILSEGLTLALIGGTPGGLAYWGIERRYSLKRLSEKIEGRVGAVGNRDTPLAHRCRGSLRRIAPKALVVLVLVTAIILGFPRWWAPHVSWWSLTASSAGMPRVDLLRELPVGNPSYPAFSPDGTRLAAHRNDQGRVVIWNKEGEIVGEVKVQHPGAGVMPPVFASGGKQIVIAGGNAPEIATPFTLSTHAASTMR
jgi:hypothetical protein